MIRCLISGGAGYIGSVLVPELLKAGHHVTVLDNFRYGQTSLNHLCANPSFDVIRGDARDKSVLQPLIRNSHIVIPLAALVGAPLCDADVDGAMTTNYYAVLRAMELMAPDQRIIIPITNSGYGIGEPGKECTEETPLRPISLYGRTKVDAEKAVMDRGNAISLRLATVFGMSPRMRLDLLVNDFVYRAMHDRFVVLFEGHFKRNYIAVRDVARAFLHAIDNWETMKNQTYNVGLSDANLSKIELCQKIKIHLPKFTYLEAPVGEDIDKRDYIVSNAKIEATGFVPAWSLDAGILELIKGFRMIRNTVHGNV